MTKLRAVVLATLIVASMIAGAAGPVAAQQGDPGPPEWATVPEDQAHRSNQTVSPDSPPDTSLPAPAQGNAGTGGPPGGLPETASRVAKEQVNDIRVSKHAATTSVDISATESGGLAVVVTDDQNHDGRQVAVPVGAFENAIGQIPDVAYGTHESGEQWSAPINVSDGYAVWTIPEFSTQTVTFEGRVNIDAQGVSNGTTFDYGLDTDSVSGYNISVTGREATEWDNETGSRVASDGSYGINLAGNADPGGPAAGAPVLAVTGLTPEHWQGGFESSEGMDKYLTTQWVANPEGETANGTTTVTFEDAPPTIDKLRLADFNYYGERNNGGGGSATPQQIWIEINGTQVYSSTDPTQSTFDINDYATSGGPVDLTITVQFSLQESVDSYDEIRGVLELPYDDSRSGWGEALIGAQAPNNVDVTVDGTTHTLGDFASGETKTITLPDLTTSASSLSFSSATGRAIDYDLQVRERSLVNNASVVVNGHRTATTATLSAGESVAFTPDKSWLYQGGENVVTVEMASLSADAPTPRLDLSYEHTASDQLTTTYDEQGLEAHYNISKQFASDQSDVELRATLDSDVFAVRNLERRTDGGDWTSVPETAYQFNSSSNRLTTQFGDVAAGETVDLRFSGVAMTATNANVSVSDPSVDGSGALLELSDVTAPVELTTSTQGASRVYDLHSADWTLGEHARVTDSGEYTLVAPNATAGSVRLAVLPVEMQVESNSAHVSVVDSTPSRPVLDISPGVGEGDDVTLTYLNAESGETWAVHPQGDSSTRIDSAVAASPVSLSLTDADRTVVIELVDGGSDGSDSQPPIPVGVGGDGISDTTLIVGAAALGLLALGLFSRRLLGGDSSGSSGGGTSSALRTIGSVFGSTAARLVRGGASLLVRLVNPIISSQWTLLALGVGGFLYGVQAGIVPREFGILVGSTALLLGVYYVLQRMGSFSPVLFGGIALVVVFGTFDLIAPGAPIVDAIAGSLGQATLILALVGAYLAYTWIQNRNQQQQVNLTVEGSDSGGDNQ